MKDMINTTLSLFHAVERKDGGEVSLADEDTLAEGLVITSGAGWAKDRIIQHYLRNRLDGKGLNKTFHKSWKKVASSSRLELLVHQLVHYLTTYGTNFQSEIYIPAEILDLEGESIPVRVVKAYTREELVDKCTDLINSGVALKQETLESVIGLMLDLGCDLKKMSGSFKNKEATVFLYTLAGIIPSDPVDALRCIVYEATGSTLLIKDRNTIDALKQAQDGRKIRQTLKECGHEKMATIFNRYKPLFLAMKHLAKKDVNRISKLSKKHHMPLVQNPLNIATHKKIMKADEHWLTNATPYALLSALKACCARISGQERFTYLVRNGRMWADEAVRNYDTKVLTFNKNKIIKELKSRIGDVSDQLVYIPDGVEYGLPTSEKSFIGNFPKGTRITAKAVAAGVYWENAWGATDLDVSSMSVDGVKTGWNARYNDRENLIYSGDITYAPEGAVEYIRASGIKSDQLLLNNVYSGDNQCGYRIVVGTGDRITKQMMMNPSKVVVDAKTNSIKNETILGFFSQNGDNTSFTLVNAAGASGRVSGHNENTQRFIASLIDECRNAVTLNDVMIMLGYRLTNVEEDATINLSTNGLERDTLLKIFQPS